MEAIEQARRAARNGVSLDVVLRRYMVGQALLWDYVMEEAGRVGEDGALREMLRAQASLLDRLMIDVAREHVSERVRAGRSSEYRLSERVRALLAGECGFDARPPEASDDLDLGYELDGEHLGVVARGAGAREVLRVLAVRLDRRLLCVARGEGMVWAWLGGRYALQMSDLERVVSMVTDELGQSGDHGDDVRPPAYLSLAVGEPARGLAGWRLTHQQAQAALAVALCRPRRFTRYADVALLATALKDELLAKSLIDTYVSPLEASRGGGTVLRETLRAYFAAERNASSTAAALGVVRNTVDNRLRIIEERLGRTLHPCPAELETAIQLDELTTPSHPEIS